MFSINAAYRIRAKNDSADANPDPDTTDNWFVEMTEEQQKHYIKEHPNSKYAKESRNRDDAQDNKPTSQPSTKKKPAPKTNPETEDSDESEDDTDSSTKKPVKSPREPSKVLWTMTDGKPPTEQQAVRLKALRVPPAWTNIKLSESPDAELQVVGKDAKGRAQYLYSAEHSTKAAAEKFARLKDFNAAASGIVKKSLADMNDASKSQKWRDSAAVVQLISKTGFRIGSDTETGADVKAHGATTLEGSHVNVDKDKITFDFIGKKGVNIKKTLVDKTLAKYIANKKAEVGDGRLFGTDDASVRDYFHKSGGGDFKVKDFRTWNATNLALELMQKPPHPDDEKSFKEKQKEVAIAVSKHLGNTPKVAMESYIDPAVWEYSKHEQ